MPQAEATRRMLAALWQRNLPILQERIQQLQRAATAAHAGELIGPIRSDATDVAHKLAGSLGMFGYPEGTRIARKIEQLLETPGEVDGAKLTAEVAALRVSLRV